MAAGPGQPAARAADARTVGPAELPLRRGRRRCTDRRRGPTWPPPCRPPAHGDGTDLLELFDAYTEPAAPTAPTATCSRPTPPSTAWTAPGPSVRRLEGRRSRPPGGGARVRVAEPLQRSTCAVWPVPATGTRRARSAPPGRRRSWSSAAPATRSRRTAGPRPWPASSSQGVLLTRVGDGHTGYRASCVHPDQRRPLPPRPDRARRRHPCSSP